MVNKKTKRARAFLEELAGLDTRIENARFDQQYWDVYSIGLSSPQGESVLIGGEMHNVEKVQSTPNPHRMEDMILNNMDSKSAIDAELSNLLIQRAAMLKVIKMLKTTEYDILHKVYVQKATLPDYAELKGRSYSWAVSQHGIAIQSLQKLLEKGNFEEW